MSKPLYYIGLILILTLALSSCQQQSQDVSQVPTGRAPAPANDGYKNISPEKAIEMMADGIRLVDVRTSQEYKSGHIPGAEFAPLDQLSSKFGSWEKDEPIMVICLSGGRSSDAANQLVNQGFSTVYNVSGGMMAYEGETKTGMEP